MNKLLDIDLKGLPRIHNISVYPPRTEDGPVTVSAILASDQRRDVERWAKRLGVEVTERPLTYSPRMLIVEAAREKAGVRREIWLTLYLADPALIAA
jgi:hypothetical protein